MADIMYRIIEWLDGEHGIKIIPYKLAEKIKWALLKNIR